MKLSLPFTSCLSGFVLLSAAWTASASCPKIEPGASYPWQTDDLMPGDKWADLQVKVDKKGVPSGCGMTKGNVDSETLFWMCQAYTTQGHFEPHVVDGQPADGIETHTIRMYGRLHLQADERARKKYFSDHPDDSPSCYPN